MKTDDLEGQRHEGSKRGGGGGLLCPGRTHTHLTGFPSPVTTELTSTTNSGNQTTEAEVRAFLTPIHVQIRREGCAGQNSFVIQQEGPRTVACHKWFH